MSTSYEIIDPSLHIMVDKASDQTSLLNENENLRNLNVIIITATIIAITGFVFLYKKTSKKEEL